MEIRLFDALGRSLAAPEGMTLGAWESIQINDVFSFFSVPGQRNARIELVRTSGSGGFFAFASVIDAVSGDAISFPLPSSPDPEPRRRGFCLRRQRPDDWHPQPVNSAETPTALFCWIRELSNRLVIPVTRHNQRRDYHQDEGELRACEATLPCLRP